MPAYLPSAGMSDGPKSQHCLPFQPNPAGTVTVMTTIPQLRTGSCVKTNLYTTKGPTHEHGNKITCKRKPLMQIPRILYAYQIQVNANKITSTTMLFGYGKIKIITRNPGSSIINR